MAIVKISPDDLLQQLIDTTQALAHGKSGNQEKLFEMTKTGVYPKLINELAESFGIMCIKVSTREYELEQKIAELKASNDELAIAKQMLATENHTLRETLKEKFSPGNILGTSSQIRNVLQQVEKVANTLANVLIAGETGTGKELIAKALHFNSDRRLKPFVALNCSALPDDLLESELFGIEKGIATGVDKRIGKIEQANSGTLFLDEIGDMPLASQAKVLRVIQGRELERVGGRKTIPVDIRIVAATHKDLKQAILDGNFRQDLFYRLNVVNITLPPLRHRTDDIPLLFNAFLTKFTRQLKRPPKQIKDDVLHRLKTYQWPGNVRELENTAERAVALSSTDIIGLDDLPEEIKAINWQQPANVTPQAGTLEEMEIDVVRTTLEAAGGNKTETARRLGLSREGLRKKMIRFGLV